MKKTISRIALTLAAAMMLTSAAMAHDFKTSFSRIRVDGRCVHVQFPVNMRDFSGMEPSKAIEENYRLEAPDAASSVVVRSSSLADGVVLLEYDYSFSHTVTNLKITSTLNRITQPDHSHIVQVGDGDDARQAVLNSASPSVEIDLRDRTIWSTAWDFIKLGIEHIFTGYDHLAFLAGLLLMTRTLPALLKVVTAFTAAHSITLALATFNIVSVPSRLIESLIALSIAYIAVENFTGRTLMQRWKVTFLFGLVHGFGFSNVLQQMALTRRTLAISLFSFNGGVELGQLVFVCAVFPLVYLISTSRWKLQFLSASSVAIALLGIFWFVERAFGL